MNRRELMHGGTILGAIATLSSIASADSGESMKSVSHIRIARPTDRMEEVVAFYRDGLGMPIIGQFANHAGYSGVMLGIPTSQCHLEFTHAAKGSPCPAPTKDNLIVLYFPDTAAYLAAVGNLEQRGHRPVEPENPYWIGKSQTFEDPDGWRVVLYDGSPFGTKR